MSGSLCTIRYIKINLQYVKTKFWKNLSREKWNLYHVQTMSTLFNAVLKLTMLKNKFKIFPPLNGKYRRVNQQIVFSKVRLSISIHYWWNIFSSYFKTIKIIPFNRKLFYPIIKRFVFYLFSKNIILKLRNFN